MKNYLLILPLIALTVGCSASKSNYAYSPKDSDAKVEFTADFNGDTIPPVHYFLNINNPESIKCSDFAEVGYYYPETSIFIFASTNKELNAAVPGNQPINIRGHYNVGGSASCYAPIQQFVAKAGGEYLVKFNQNNKMCHIEVIDKKTQTSVPLKVLGNYCSK